MSAEGKQDKQNTRNITEENLHEQRLTTTSTHSLTSPQFADICIFHNSPSPGATTINSPDLGSSNSRAFTPAPLPNEIWYYILNHCHIESIPSLRQTCRTFHSYLSDTAHFTYYSRFWNFSFRTSHARVLRKMLKEKLHKPVFDENIFHKVRIEWSGSGEIVMTEVERKERKDDGTMKRRKGPGGAEVTVWRSECIWRGYGYQVALWFNRVLEYGEWKSEEEIRVMGDRYGLTR